jgi:hypothetical protein
MTSSSLRNNLAVENSGHLNGLCLVLSPFNKFPISPPDTPKKSSEEIVADQERGMQQEEQIAARQDGVTRREEQTAADRERGMLQTEQTAASRAESLVWHAVSLRERRLVADLDEKPRMN